MPRIRSLLVAATTALTLVGAAGINAGASESRLIEFDSMTPVTTGTTTVPNDRGIPGGGLPWVISSGSGSVDRQGHLSVSVTGLVLPAVGNTTGPIKQFSATVSCLTPAGPMNVTTGLFDTTPTGDSTIVDTVALPHPCKSPEVFVGTTKLNGQFVWFAESNAESED
jgi:hypothetical protein